MNLSTTKMTSTVMSNLTSNLTNTSDFFGKQKKNGIPKYLNKNFEKIFFYNFFFNFFSASKSKRSYRAMVHWHDGVHCHFNYYYGECLHISERTRW